MKKLRSIFQKAARKINLTPLQAILLGYGLAMLVANLTGSSTIFFFLLIAATITFFLLWKKA